MPPCHAYISDDGIRDASGNLKEWTADITGQTADGIDIAVLRGGAYDTPAVGTAVRVWRQPRTREHRAPHDRIPLLLVQPAMTPRRLAVCVALLAQLGAPAAAREPAATPVAFDSATDAAFDVRVESRSPPRVQVCGTPCTLHLEAGLYRLEARAPDRLDLHGELRVEGRPIAVDLNAMTEARLVSGGALVIGGSAAAAVGLMWLLFQELVFEPTLAVDGPERDIPERRPLLVLGIGGGTALLGAVILATGDHGFRVRPTEAPRPP